jgi:hypothetical protein
MIFFYIPPAAIASSVAGSPVISAGCAWLFNGATAAMDEAIAASN